MVTGTLVVPPALVTEQGSVLTPSVRISAGAQPLTVAGVSGSLWVHDTSTSLRYQPPSPSGVGGSRMAVTTGGVRSIAARARSASRKPAPQSSSGPMVGRQSMVFSGSVSALRSSESGSAGFADHSRVATPAAAGEAALVPKKQSWRLGRRHSKPNTVVAPPSGAAISGLRRRIGPPAMRVPAAVKYRGSGPRELKDSAVSRPGSAWSTAASVMAPAAAEASGPTVAVLVGCSTASPLKLG